MVHFIILYGSFTGLGLYQFFKYSLAPIPAIIGAVVFVIVCTLITLLYDKYELKVKATLKRIKQNALKLFKRDKN